MICRSVLLVAAFLVPGGLAGADMAAAGRAFAEGRYAAAIAETAAVGSADAAALRARAVLARAMSGAAEPAAADLTAALAAAEEALALDPAHGEGRLQKAIALSLMVRPMSLRRAHESGFGETAKALAEGVLADDPGNHYAHGFLAVWHVEVHRRGGRIGALMMGASLDDAAAHYAEAVRLAPQDAGLRWQYARALAALDADRNATVIDQELGAALAIDPATELDRVMQARARALLAVVAGGEVREIEAAARGML